MTRENGKLHEHLQYFPFGETWIQQGGNTEKSPYLFTAKELDEETGLYYYGARYYDPCTSVWQSPDPILEKYLPTVNKKQDRDLPGMGGVFSSFNLSLYKYSRQNPIVYFDPDGRLETATHYRRTSVMAVRYHPVNKAWKSHKGADYEAPMFSDVHALAAGTVVEVKKGKGYGTLVLINHGRVTEGPLEGKYVMSLIAHLEAVAVSPGEWVGEGQPVAQSGATGTGTGPHTHEEIIIANSPTYAAAVGNNEERPTSWRTSAGDVNIGKYRWQNGQMVERPPEELEKDPLAPSKRAEPSP